MTRLVSLAETKMRLRLDDTDSNGRPDDSDIELFIAGASRAVLNYIASSDPSFLDSYGEPVEDSAGEAINIPDDIKNATLFLVGILMRDRDGQNVGNWEHGFLPAPVLCLLYPYRMPTLA